MTEKVTVGGLPVECLTGEPAVIWSGWRTLGDRELVREASAKGTHINLAYKCLAYRRNICVEDAFNYFAKEVEIWIMELLLKHQVYRASHILKNVGKNPTEYIFEVCLRTKDPSLRSYLSEYMINIARFEKEHINSWNIIKAIVEYEHKQSIQDGLSTVVSINDILKLPDEVKTALCTELYFSMIKQSIAENITHFSMWQYLLADNRMELIQLWININYNSDSLQEDLDVNTSYKQLFSSWTLTSDMIEYIDSSYASDLVKELTKNHLCRYGVFVKNESQDIKLLLSRIFGSGLTLKKLHKILSLSSCNVKKTEFLQQLDEQLCLAHCLQEKHDEKSKQKLSELYKVFSTMCNAQEDNRHAVVEGIFRAIYYLTDNVDDFLKENYLITLALVFFYLSKENEKSTCKVETPTDGNSTLRDIFTKKIGLKIGNYYIPHEILQHALHQTPILQYAIDDNDSEENDATVYDLLDGYKNLNVKRLFKWRFENEPMPTFSNEQLVKKYGYTETLTYGYYLKEGRPNMAIYNLMHQFCKVPGSLSPQRKYRAALYAHILALKTLDKPEITCSCISFIEMLGISAENLRLHVTAANYVQQHSNIGIGDLLEGIIYKNEHDLKTVISYLEASFKNHVKDKNIKDSTQFEEAVRAWDVIVRFTKAHNVAPPDSFLLMLAKQNYWFEFILVCDICNYPVSQVLQNASLFEDTILKEHLLTCFKRAARNEQKLKLREEQQPTYSKTGSKPKDSNSTASPKSPLSPTKNKPDIGCGTPERFSSSEDGFSEENDLWMTILKCHQSPDPPGALITASRQMLKPILTVLATCYEPSSIPVYCYIWMVISTANEEILSDYKECLDYQLWPANKVFDLFNRMVLEQYTSTLSRAIKIFMPDNCLNSFFEYLSQCTNYGDFKDSQYLLLEFKSQCSTLKCNKIMDWDCSDATYMKNSYWVSTVALRCIITALGHNFLSVHLQSKFLDTLIKCNFDADLPVQCPDFRNLLRITRVLQKTNVALNFKAFKTVDNHYNFDEEIERCIDALLRVYDYDNALEIASLAGFDRSEIILAKCRSEFEQSVARDGKVGNEFWIDCASNFEKCSIQCEKAAEFFVEHAEKVQSHKERHEILKLAFETIKHVHPNKQTIDTLEMAMWKSCILAGPDALQSFKDNYIFNKLKTELLSGLSSLQISCTFTDEYERSACDALINRLIDLGRLDIALRITTIFNHEHKDLQILLLCLSLAESEILPHELTADQRNLLAETTKPQQQKFGGLKNRRLRRLSSSSSLASSTLSPSASGEIKTKDESFYKVQQECLFMLQELREKLIHGSDICFRILLCYKLSVKLGQAYQLLLRLSNPIQFLQEISETNIEEKLEVINDIIVAYKISNESVAIFLTENITSSINHAIEAGREDAITLWEYPLNTKFHVIMELCTDVSALGWQLLKATHKLLGHSHGGKRDVGTLKTAIELLIRSHDCFTAACNMEGIASVLRKCQNLANILQTLKHWTLLVRLVTGVGRFTEMSYIFEILKANDHFEFLLGKGLDKVTGLKTALLEFLKRQCPNDKELFTLVALHFRLYNEIALMWESEAKEVIKNLVSSARKEWEKTESSTPHVAMLTRTDFVQKQLQLAMTNYTHASQYYLQDNKLNLASRCSDQSQLVALQLTLLGNVSHNYQVVCILNLKPEEVEKILCQTLNFSQTLVVVRAYNHHVDWVNLVYNHCVLNDDMKYLKDFTAAIKLTPNLVQDCARRYRLEKSITQKMTVCMKTLVSGLSDVESKYAMASQLGFKDIVEIMLNDPTIEAYLKDTVWKKGFSTA